MAETLTSLIVKLGWVTICEWVQKMDNLSESVDSIMLELRSMNAVLKERNDDENISLLEEEFVDRVRDMANQVEDLIDEYIFLHSEPPQENRLFAFGGNLIRQTKNVGTQTSIANDIERIKSKLEDARKRYDRFDNISKPNNTLENGSCSTHTVLDSRRWFDPQEDGHFRDNLVGIEGPKAELIKRLVQGNHGLEIVPVGGMGGMGKTTLVRKVYEDSNVNNRFKIRIWINVSTNSTVEELFRKVIEQYFKGSMKQAPEKLGTMKGLEMKEEVKKLLQNKRYLIVLDDVQNLDKWQACRFAFPKNNLGSRVIITTQSGDVICESQHPVYDLKPLSENESRDLFCFKAFGKKTCPDHLVGVCDDILKKCAGLPLGIVAIGGMFRGKNPTVAEWNNINKSLGTELQGNKSLGSMHKILLRSYHDMSHDMKPCLLYMSIFPGDHLNEHNKLIRLLVAEGFVAQDEGRTADDVAETYLSELLSRSLIQVAARRSDGRVKSYRIHGLTREILMMKSKAQNFAAISNKTTSSYPKVRRLLMQKDCLNLCGTLKKLRSLLLFEVQEPLTKYTMPVLFNKGKLKLLTVLDLQGAKMDNFPSAITDLLNLRYLSLRDTGVKNIPNSIGRLRKLETLDLKWTKVLKLPNQIKHLRQLQNLLLYQYYDDKNGAFPSKHGFQAPKGIRELKSLQKLCFIEAGKDSGSIVNELGNLTRMRRLGIIKLRRNLVGALWSSIEKMSLLRALSVTASKGETVDLQGLGSPPRCLERLYLTGALVSFPQWIESPELQNLVKIFLKSSNLDHNSLAKLGELRNLLHIELQQVYDGKQLRFGRDKFEKLKILGLRRLGSLETVTIEEKSMPCLEKFQIQECGRLATVPLGIELLKNLRVLDFVDMPEEIYTRIQPSNVQGNPVQGIDYVRIKHISEVCFIKKEDNVWISRRVSTVMTNPSASDERSDNDVKKDLNHSGTKMNFPE